MTDRRVRVDGPAGAPVLALSSPLGTTAEVWEPQMPALRSRFRVVRYEHPGHGGREAPTGPCSIEDLGTDLLAVLDEVGAGAAAVVGLSLGGTVALWLAVNHPGRVDRLVVACSRAHWSPVQPWSEQIEMMRAGRPSDLIDSLLPSWFTPGYLAGHPGARTRVAAMLDATLPEGYAGCCAALASADLRPGLGSITAPTLVLAGAGDPAGPISEAAALAEAVPGAGLQVIAPGAHLLNIEQPDRFTAAVVDHLAGTVVERGRATRRAVLGDRHVDRSEGTASPLSEPFVDMITRYAWGDIWTRPGLDRRTRSCITLALLVSLGRLDELELHLIGARRNGLSDAEIGEVLIHSAVYCGVPAANSAFAVARRVLEADGPG